MPLKATSLWINRTLIVPDRGSVNRPPNGILSGVDPAIEQWLLQNGYVEHTDSADGDTSVIPSAVTPMDIPPASTPIVGDQGDTSEESDEESDDDSNLEDWQQQVLEFLRSADQDAIAAVKGISDQKAKEIVAEREKQELTWESVDGLLTVSHFKALQTHLKVQE